MGKKGKRKNPCKIHVGEKGGRYEMHRKKGGGTERVYLKRKGKKK